MWCLAILQQLKITLQLVVFMLPYSDLGHHRNLFLPSVSVVALAYLFLDPPNVREDTVVQGGSSDLPVLPSPGNSHATAGDDYRSTATPGPRHPPLTPTKVYGAQQRLKC